MIGRLTILLLAASLLLSACSFEEGEARAAPTRQSESEPRSVLTGQALSGRLLYVRDGQLWLHQEADARPLSLEGSAHDPAWSPDGERVAYVQRQESFSDLYILDVGSGETTQVTFNGRSEAERRTQEYVHQIFWAAEPTWSPDGDEIIFLSQESPATYEGALPSLYEFPLSLYRYEIQFISAREPNNTDLLQVDQGQSDVLSPAWSPDGRYLAYVEAPREEMPRRIMLYDFETGQAGPYPGIPDGAYDPAWSPDGSMLAFAAPQDGATDIWMIAGPASNGMPQRLTELGRARAPAWAPDGGSVAFLNVGDDSTDLYVVELETENGSLEPGEPIAVTRGADIDATAGLSWTE